MADVSDSRYFSEKGPVPDRRRGGGRREEIRMATKSTPATLCATSRLPIDVQIRDVSRCGLGMVTPSPVLVGSSVLVVCGGLTINGTVGHCGEGLTGGYSVGIRITRIVDTRVGKEV